MLDLNIGVMLIEAGIFLVTLILLKMWLFDPLVKFMDEREEKLKKSLEMINANSEDSKELEEEIQRVLAEAKKEAKAIRDEARAKAQAEAAEMKAKRLAEIEAAKEELAKEIQAEKEKILAELSTSKEEIKTLVENKIRNAA
ncbi:putative H+-transporting two-sector ATPase, B/B' subunit [Nautilia profundicola AmH]|uniref:ATP synthase subunit b n=1 Tax=Nautilia profundicola (strain ATCC BAA-1463 / DSM 18972 / AmH) TaxID=598659 RepID=B9L7Y2_NAUPA|nr:ATPase [Nautilia profundicola]ACM93433.1 putative H+-transporting two-sector ATPase, B/B' subunit [Nautilia profundicola AmH]